jgi:DNA-binding response OmpR family regulator
MCVLVVEDDEALGQTYVRSLKALGQKAHLVKNSDEAVAHFQSGKYGLVLMDIGLPGKDGLTATRELKSIEEGVPVVGVTAGYSTRQECLNAGMCDYYIKPILIQDMKTIIKRYALEKRCVSN